MGRSFQASSGLHAVIVRKMASDGVLGVLKHQSGAGFKAMERQVGAVHRSLLILSNSVINVLG